MKIKTAFVKYGGCCSGGTEKYLQTIAAHLPKDKFEVDYYYCDATPYIGSDWKHPDTEQSRIDYLKKHNINVIKFDVGFKDVTKPHHPWINTNFWEIFDESKYDIISTGRAGHAEYPFTEIQNKWIVDIVTLPNMAERKQNIFKTIHISKYQLDTWIKAGGEASKGVVLPIVSDMPIKTNKDLRKELGIPKDAFVYGMHQRVDDGIFSPVALEAFKELKDENAWFVIMGGSEIYTKQAIQFGIKNFKQIDYSSNLEILDKFLNTLDVFAHGRADGETFGLSIAEGMSYGLPVISHVAPATGHIETIGDAGKVCDSQEEYIDTMRQYKNDKDLYKLLSQKSIKRYKENFSINVIVKQVAKIFEEAVNTKPISELTDEEFWEGIW